MRLQTATTSDADLKRHSRAYLRAWRKYMKIPGVALAVAAIVGAEVE